MGARADQFEVTHAAHSIVDDQPRRRSLESIERSALPRLRLGLVDSQIAAAGLALALEALGAPAFLARADGHVDCSNEAGARMLKSEHALAERLSNLIREGGASSFEPPVEAVGFPKLYLVVLRESETTERARLKALEKSWTATRAEVSVLRWLVTGDSNKEIAAKLGRSEVSVERHVTSLLRKAHCDCRARLIAAFWSNPRSGEEG